MAHGGSECRADGVYLAGISSQQAGGAAVAGAPAAQVPAVTLLGNLLIISLVLS